MGEVVARIRVQGPKGSADLEALVDTGATFTKIPVRLASKLGLEAKYETQVELGEGRVIERALAMAEIEMDGVARPVLVTVGEEGEKPLVGYTTLEHLGFKVNPLTRRLEKTTAIEYRGSPKSDGSHSPPQSL